MMENSSNQYVNMNPKHHNINLIYQSISSVISKNQTNYGSYIRIKTSIPFFKPTYLLTPIATFRH